MKTFKKIMALVIAMVMVVAMSIPAMATPTTTNSLEITNTGKTEHTFELYQIVTGDIDGDTLSNLNWGNGVATAFQTAANMDALKALSTEADIKAYADTIASSLQNPTTSPAVAAGGKYKFEGLTSGYYLVKDKASTQDQPDVIDGAYTQYIVKIVGAATANTKLDVPSVQKKVDDKDDSKTTEDKITWQDSADYDIGDSVPFQFKGTLPTNYAEYSTYYYEFSDTMGSGLTYNSDAKVYAAIGDNWYDITAGFDITGAISSIKTTDLKAITTGKLVTFDDEDTELIKSTADEATTIAIDKDTLIYVRYSATLNENCDKTATGNPNEVKLIYSNNPEGDGKGETSPDKVKVYTFTTVVNKVETDAEATTEEKTLEELNMTAEEAVAAGWTLKEGTTYTKTTAATTKPLTGAAFTIYKKVLDSTLTGAKTGATLKTELTGTNSAINADALEDASYYVAKAMTASGATHTLEGLDAGDYVVVETTIPAGYNAYVSQAFTITATHSIEDDDPQLLTLEGGAPVATVDKTNATLSGDILNQKGTILPETGGIGTTIFYVVGAILVLGAGIILVTKRRMSAN